MPKGRKEIKRHNFTFAIAGIYERFFEKGEK